jgi:hypothetical protein
LPGIYSQEGRKFKVKENFRRIFIPDGIERILEKVSKIAIFILIKLILIGIFHDRDTKMFDIDSNSIPIALLLHNTDLTFMGR